MRSRLATIRDILQSSERATTKVNIRNSLGASPTRINPIINKLVTKDYMKEEKMTTKRPMSGCKMITLTPKGRLLLDIMRELA